MRSRPADANAASSWNTAGTAKSQWLSEALQGSGVELRCSSTAVTMGDVLFHEEVRAFTSALCQASGQSSGSGSGEEGDEGVERYELACEHEHSCCVLIGSTRLQRKEDGRWMTWIDYEAFQRCITRW